MNTAKTKLPTIPTRITTDDNSVATSVAANTRGTTRA